MNMGDGDRSQRDSLRLGGSPPLDLIAVLAIVLTTWIAVFTPVVNETPLRVILGLPFILFVPGYAVVSALFPRNRMSRMEDSRADEAASLDSIERVALSFGFSVVVVSLLGLGFSLTPWGMGPMPTVLAVGTVTILAATVGARRRRRIPEVERGRILPRRWYTSARGAVIGSDLRRATLGILLITSALLAAGSVGYAIAEPKEGEPFSEFYLLTENENGTPVAAGYPDTLAVGEDHSLIIGVDNQEGKPITYTVVVELQRVRVENGTTDVLASERLHRFRTRLAPGETWRHQHSVAPTMAGQRLRLTYHLYVGTQPTDTTGTDPYRELYLWVDVAE